MSIFKKEHKDTKEYLDRQQNLDAILILSKLLEPGMATNTDQQTIVRNKISQLLDKI